LGDVLNHLSQDVFTIPKARIAGNKKAKLSG
jgi:hypothetical protein